MRWESIFHEGELKVQELAGDVRPCTNFLKLEAAKSQYHLLLGRRNS
jgi:hypothetical protein